MELGHLLTRSGLTYPEVSSKVYHDSFCQLGSSFIILGNLFRGILFTCYVQLVLYSMSKIGVIFNSFAICAFVLYIEHVYTLNVKPNDISVQRDKFRWWDTSVSLRDVHSLSTHPRNSVRIETLFVYTRVIPKSTSDWLVKIDALS